MMITRTARLRLSPDIGRVAIRRHWRWEREKEGGAVENIKKKKTSCGGHGVLCAPRTATSTDRKTKSSHSDVKTTPSAKTRLTRNDNVRNNYNSDCGIDNYNNLNVFNQPRVLYTETRVRNRIYYFHGYTQNLSK